MLLYSNDFINETHSLTERKHTMHRLTVLCVETITAAVFLIPIFLYLHKNLIHNFKTSLLYLLFALYLAAIYDAAGLPNILYFQFFPRFNHIPFRYMFSDYGSSLLNVLLFIPFGFFLPLLWQNFRRLGKTLLLGFCASLFIEFFQIFSLRATDINDLITNVLGTSLGYLSARCILFRFPAIAWHRPDEDLLRITGIVILVMFFPQVYISDLLWSFIL